MAKYIKSDLISKKNLNERKGKDTVKIPENLNVYEQLTWNLRIYEQYVDVVLECSARYNRATSVLYSPENLKGKPSKYPNSGDHPWAYMLRSYGKWWNECEAAQRPYVIPTEIQSEDFVVVKYELPVIPSSVTIYETYNPGSIVRIYARTTNKKWYLLWKIAPSQFKKITEAVRIFTPPIKKLPILVDVLRIEFNQSLLKYHTAIDAILLAGYRPEGFILEKLISDEYFQEIPTPFEKQNCGNLGLNYVKDMPNEVMLKIFKYLDLETLGRCAQVSRHWKNVTDTSILYSAIDLKKYWYKIDKNVLEQISRKFKIIKKLDFSWCGNSEMEISPEIFISFLDKCCSKQLTHLSLNYCDFLSEVIVSNIGKFSEITDLRLRNCKVNERCYMGLAYLMKLVSLDLSSSSIEDPQLIAILSNNWDLEHLNVDNCYGIGHMDNITRTISIYNKNLVSISTWQIPTLSVNGVANLALCNNLRELDFGWCLMLSEAGNSLEVISQNCSNLRKLVISGWRGVTDQSLKDVIMNCPQLYHLDILGIRNMSNEIIDLAFRKLSNLKLLDISYCPLITREQIKIWKEKYPEVTIQRSCDPHM